MKRLTGGDVFHLHREDAGQPSHTIKVAVVGTGDGTVDADAVAAWAADRLPRHEPLRWQLQPIPLRLGRPVWVDRPDLDAGHHIRRRTLSGVDPARELDDLIGELAGHVLDRDRPLWRLWVIDGIDEGDVALVLQLHHALADGSASVRLWAEIFADTPPSVDDSPAPDQRELLVDAARHHLANLASLPGLLRRMKASNDAKKGRPADAPVVDYLQAPPTPFNQLPSLERAAAFVTLSLADLKDLARRLDGTVNDLYAAVCAGATRAYLLERDALPDISLTATSPVALDRPAPDYGNSMTSWFWSMATAEPDPLARFRAIQTSLRAARELQAEDPSLLPDLQEHARTYETLWWLLGRAERGGERPMVNVIVSNVRGPEPLSWNGHPVTALRSLGPLTGRMGLNLTAWSYVDEFTIGLHACRAMVPDLARFAALLKDAFDELDAHSPQ